MNEKFKLLALEAKMGTADFDAGSYYVATPDRMQRFAELIVQECVEVCEALKEDDGFDANFARTTCANEIRQHFGVDV